MNNPVEVEIFNKKSTTPGSAGVVVSTHGRGGQELWYWGGFYSLV